LLTAVGLWGAKACLASELRRCARMSRST
jgi:hypothetical protein